MVTRFFFFLFIFGIGFSVIMVILEYQSFVDLVFFVFIRKSRFSCFVRIFDRRQRLRYVEFFSRILRRCLVILAFFFIFSCFLVIGFVFYILGQVVILVCLSLDFSICFRVWSLGGVQGSGFGICFFFDEKDGRIIMEFDFCILEFRGWYLIKQFMFERSLDELVRLVEGDGDGFVMVNFRVSLVCLVKYWVLFIKRYFLDMVII